MLHRSATWKRRLCYLCFSCKPFLNQKRNWAQQSFAYFEEVIAVVYGSLAVWQTRMGLGLLPPLRPEEEARRYHIVSC